MREKKLEGDLTPTEHAWLGFLRAHNPPNAPEPTLHFVRLMIGICERRAG